MSKNELLKEEVKMYSTFTFEEKREYFINYFIFELMSALTKIRKSKKITQKELSALMGVKQSYISQIENLEKIPTIETIAKYSFAINSSLDFVDNLINDVENIFNSDCELPTLNLKKANNC